MSDAALQTRRGAALVQFAGLLSVPSLGRFSLRGELPSLANALRAARVPVSQTAFEVAGPSARMLLNTGCPLDLADASFPVGMCSRTLFEKSEIVLWRTAVDTFHVEVWRSFAPYVTGVLAQAARELGAHPGGAAAP